MPPSNWTGYWTWGDGPTHTKGYTVRRGDFKGVVVNCSEYYNNTSAYYRQPSPWDTWALYNLAVDPFETEDIALSHEEEVASLRDWVMRGNFTCSCFQCGWG
jgi:hypothetical protein